MAVPGEAPLPADELAVFYKVGVFGCAPLDFMPRVAETYEAGLVSSDQIRFDMIQERDQAGFEKRTAQIINSKDINRRLYEQAGKYALQGDDVVLDKFMNSPLQRGDAQKFAQKYGGITVALSIHAPFKLARDRVREWTDTGNLTVPVDRWNIPPLLAMRQMADSLKRPRSEGINFVFKLDGEGTADEMLDELGNYMERAGLTD